MTDLSELNPFIVRPSPAQEARQEFRADHAIRKAKYLAEVERLDRLEDELKACIQASGPENVLACFLNAADGTVLCDAVSELYVRLYKGK